MPGSLSFSPGDGLGDEGLHLLQEVEAIGLPVGQDLRIGPRLVIGQRRLVGDLDAAQELDVHVAFIAGQPQPHRIALAGLDALAVLVHRDHGVIHRLGERHAAAEMGRIRALGDQPLRLRIDAGLLQQRGEQNAGPFRARCEAVQRLHVGLDRFVGEQRRAVAAAFDEADARHHRIALERVEGEHQRLLDHAVDDELVLGGVDVGHAAMADGEVQAVRRDDALEQMVRGACAGVARLVLGIVDGAHDRLFERGGRLIGRDGIADFEAPRPIRQRLGRGSRHRPHRARAHGAGEHDAASQQRAAVEQAVAGHLRDRMIASRFGSHGLSPGNKLPANRFDWPARERSRCDPRRSISPAMGRIGEAVPEGGGGCPGTAELTLCNCSPRALPQSRCGRRRRGMLLLSRCGVHNGSVADPDSGLALRLGARACAPRARRAPA